MMSFRMTPFLAVFLCASSPAQWEDIRRIGNGGETYVSSDDAGTVYISSHIPVQVIVSRDWGATFGKPYEFPNSLGDMLVYARPNGKAIVTYMYPFSTQGMASAVTDDYGKTWKDGKGIPGRPLDREWVTTNEATDEAFMIYSDGYIGGPKSKGVFIAKSTDGGLNWKEISRVDNEEEGDYAIDPHLVSSSDGKLYAFWTTSSDYNTVDTYRFATSTDGGKTWGKFSTIAKVNKKVSGKDMDTQERWMLGGVAASGEKEVMAFYVNYVPVPVSGEDKPCLVTHVRYSHDAGATWTESKPVLNPTELGKAAKLYAQNKTADANNAQYMQCLSWGFYDRQSRPHFVWQDNRDGQAKLNDSYYNQWRVRHAWATKPGEESFASEPVSRPVVCIRPPLDFLCATADSKYVYVTWTETPKATDGWAFTGEFWFGRKKID